MIIHDPWLTIPAFLVTLPVTVLGFVGYVRESRKHQPTNDSLSEDRSRS